MRVHACLPYVRAVVCSIYLWVFWPPSSCGPTVLRGSAAGDARQRCLGAARFLTCDPRPSLAPVRCDQAQGPRAALQACPAVCVPGAGSSGNRTPGASCVHTAVLRAKPGVRSKPFTAVTGLWSGDGWAASSSRPIWPGAELSLTVRAKLPSQLRAPSSHGPVNPPVPGRAPNCCSSKAAPSLLRWAYCPKGTPTHTTCPRGAPSRVGVLCRIEWPPGSRLRGCVQIPLGLVSVHVCVCLGDVCDCGWDVCSWAPAACAGARCWHGAVSDGCSQ